MTIPAGLPSSIQLQRHVSLATLSTLKVGGTAQWFTQVHELEQFQQAQRWAEKERLPILYMGEGSNMLFSDGGLSGLVVQNCVTGREHSENEVELGAGETLEEVIRWLNGLGLAGMERLYGIPGTIAGALVGNAGAYGQQIGDSVVQVSFWSENQVKVLSASDLEFRYRHSLFQTRRQWFILNCRLRLKQSRESLQDISEEILSRRLVKYPVGLKCPGSFFKNITLDEISKKALEKIPEDFIMFGKIPAGKLLEAVGANGVRCGDAQFATYHGNLIINLDQATSSDILSLANEYAERVWERFFIRLEPEIRITQQKGWPNLTFQRNEDE
ncbi:UDP-N-acetylmuramate dehydrogenase [Acidobacteria bacterium AH-259-D05]|nr:UDP-N-acetylmuramate dehydrogenase [Acidobacteria bacterium AH-259-D05]